MSRAEFLKHRKPGAAMRHVPAGHTEMKDCPMCHGKGKVKKADAMTERLLKRA
jgi:hypothetical protein